MKYTISSDIPGRIRVRYGRYRFSREMETAVAAHFKRLSCVQEVQVSSITGSVLVRYRKGNRQALLDAFGTIRFSALVAGEAAEDRRLFNTAFRSRLYYELIKRFAQRYLLPAPVRAFLTVWRSLRFIRRAGICFRQRRVGEELLDAAAVVTSILQGNYDTASSIMFLLHLSEMLEQHTLKSTTDILRDSLILHTDYVWVRRAGRDEKIPMRELKLQDRVVVRCGSTIPVDGLVVEGEAVVNQASMTGESMGVFKKRRAQRLCGHCA